MSTERHFSITPKTSSGELARLVEGSTSGRRDYAITRRIAFDILANLEELTHEDNLPWANIDHIIQQYRVPFGHNTLLASATAREDAVRTAFVPAFISIMSQTEWDSSSPEMVIVSGMFIRNALEERKKQLQQKLPLDAEEIGKWIIIIDTTLIDFAFDRLFSLPRVSELSEDEKILYFELICSLPEDFQSMDSKTRIKYIPLLKNLRPQQAYDMLQARAERAGRRQARPVTPHIPQTRFARDVWHG